MWGDSSDLKLKINKGSGTDSLYVRTQVILNNKIVCLGSHIWIEFLCCRFPHIYIFYWAPIIVSSEKGGKRNILDADTMYGNTLLQGTQKACVSHSQVLLQWTTSTILKCKIICHIRDTSENFVWSGCNRY